MRIGIFTDAYVPQIGGVSTASQLIKKYLGKLGHEVYVITTTDKDAQEEERVIRFPSVPFVSEKRIGLNINPQLNKQLRTLNLDLVHTQTEYPMGILGRTLARRQGLPLVHTFHTLYNDWMEGQLGQNFFADTVISAMNLYLKQHLKSADALIVPSQKTLDFVQSYGLEIPTHILATGIELDKFFEAAKNTQGQSALRAKLGIPDKAFVAVNVGRVSDEKRINVVLDYIAEAVHNHPELYFLSVGSGPRLEDYREAIKSRNLDQQIKFIGQVPLKDVQNYYAVGNVFVCASKSETQGLTYIEAMASGLPLLIWPDPCLDQVFQEGENGLSFSSREEFHRNLETLIEDTDLRTSMQKKALTKSREYSVEEFAKKLEAIYLSVL